jgi:hypothetical protein
MRSKNAAQMCASAVLAMALVLLLGACSGADQTGAISVTAGPTGPGEVYGGTVRDAGGKPPRSAPTLSGGYPSPATLRDKARQKLQDEADALRQKAYFTMPKLVGVNLQTAQDTLQSFGSYLLGQIDATGAHRSQLVDKDWKVCSQTPKPGTKIAIIALVTLRSVKLSEKCPK